MHIYMIDMHLFLYHFMYDIKKKHLFIEAPCRPLFTKYEHGKPLLPFQNTA